MDVSTAASVPVMVVSFRSSKISRVPSSASSTAASVVGRPLRRDFAAMIAKQRYICSDGPAVCTAAQARGCVLPRITAGRLTEEAQRETPPRQLRFSFVMVD